MRAIDPPRDRTIAQPGLAPSAPAGEAMEALLQLGYGAVARGERARAAAILDRVARERPDQPHPCAGLARALPKVPRSRIVEQFRASLRLAPDDLRLCEAYAGFLLDGDQAEQALPVLHSWLERQPNAAAAHTMAGIALNALGRFGAALDHLQCAVSLAPGQAACWANLGMLLKTVGDFRPALNAYAEAVARDPDNPRLRVNRAVALLHAGCWPEAWTDYEYRLLLPGRHALAGLGPLLPTLSPTVSLEGRSVLVTHEEGFGDTIQFARYVPLLAQHGARVLVWVPAPLERLFAPLPGIAELLVGNLPVPPHDFHCPMLSLPRAFGATTATVPNAPYLRPAADLVAAWAGRVPRDGLRVGLAWAGQSRPWLPDFAALDRRRSAGLAALAPLAAVPGIRLVSLQTGPAAAEAAAPPARLQVDDHSTALTDFAETAALIANLDLVISVDTAVVHLAGAMGKPVFLLDRYDNCWRWLSGRADSPWYPSMTIFRQSQPGDWTEPVSRAAAALEAMALFRGAEQARVLPAGQA
ncbi:MAG TPA: tetratricopeptide repeat protein [Acetobacteraceae bacterium]|nr:tetratricopeptide repeat protein [Acetobacteraceae bacterium]